VRFVLLIEAGGTPKIHRLLGRNTPSQIRSEFPRALRKFCVGIDSSFCSAARRVRFCVLRQEPHSSVCVERFGSVAPPPKPLTPVPGSREPPFGRLAMNTQRLARHHEAREALVLSVAGVTAIMLIANLLLLIFY